jgi:hypothetical protein
MWTIEKSNPLIFLLSLIVCMPWACWWRNITHTIILLEISFSCLPQLFFPHLHKLGAVCDKNNGERKVECN